MIKILIVTDDVDSWMIHISEELNLNRGRWATLGLSSRLFRSEMFYIRIVRDTSDNLRGLRFSTCILDKPLSSEEKAHLMPLLRHNTVYSPGYYRSPRNRF